jgi:glycerophosphoryl diester phosphodiesterase
MASVLNILEPLFLKTADRLYRWLPRPVPVRERLRRCRIVSHRGEHDNRTVFENTLAAFDAAAEAGVWGLELDVRWTRDLHPVVIHDAGLARVYGRPENIADLTLAQLESLDLPVPTLEEVIDRYGGRRHLMVEIKAGTLVRPDRQNRRFKALFARLIPGHDFHLISLAPEEFPLITFVSPAALLPISRLNIRRLERLVFEKGYGGLTGHYLFMTTACLRRLHAAGRRTGTGFANHRHLLFREINRGVDWIFSDRAVHLQAICQS